MSAPVNNNNEVPVWAVPKSSANKVEGWVEDSAGQQWLKVRITAAPEDGKANKALLKFLAKEWKVPASNLQITTGETSKYKKIRWIS